jgi:outer membrane protein assembly factor BamB
MRPVITRFGSPLAMAKHITRREALGRVAAIAAFAGFAKRRAWGDDATAANSVFPPKGSWPNFRNGLDLRGVAETTLPENLSLLWEREVADGCVSTPAIVVGRAYVGTLSGDLLCLDLADGKEHWKYRTLVTTDPKTFVPGFNSPVTVTQDYVLCGDDEGTLHCVDRTTGAKKWTFNSEGLIVGAASVVGERVVFGSHSQYLYGLDLGTGELLWKFDAQGPINGTQAFSGKHTFVTGCSEPVLYVVDVETGQQAARAPLEDLLIASPAIKDDILYFGTSEGLVLALDWQKQQTVWKFEMAQKREVHSAPAVTEDLVIIGGRDKTVYALDRKTGEKRWTFATRAAVDNSPVVVGDRVFFGSEDKTLYAVGLKDGVERWKYSAGESFGECSPAVGEQRLVIATSGPPGRILCFGEGRRQAP